MYCFKACYETGRIFRKLFLVFGIFLIFWDFPKNVLAQSPYPNVTPVVGVNKVVFGFLPYFESSFDPTNLKYLTHIVDWDVFLSAPGTIKNSNNLPRLITDSDGSVTTLPAVALKYAIVPILGINCADADTHAILSTYSTTGALENIVQFMQQNGYQGVNVDFEAVTQTDKDLFTSFMTDLAVTVYGTNPTYQVTADGLTGDQPAYSYAGVANSTDGWFVELYNYHGPAGSSGPVPSDPSGSTGTEPGPIAPLYGSQLWGTAASSSVDGTIQDAYVTEGAPTGKLILGFPYYGFTWQTVSTIPGANDGVAWEKIYRPHGHVGSSPTSGTTFSG